MAILASNASNVSLTDKVLVREPDWFLAILILIIIVTVCRELVDLRGLSGHQATTNRLQLLHLQPGCG